MVMLAGTVGDDEKKFSRADMNKILIQAIK